jgi:hypothetical protein
MVRERPLKNVRLWMDLFSTPIQFLEIFYKIFKQLDWHDVISH